MNRAKLYKVIKKIINESDDLEWAQDLVNNVNLIVTRDNVKFGDKVVRGPDWGFGHQGEYSIYGIVERMGRPTPDEYSSWVHVSWIGKDGKSLHRNDYRVGPTYYDLEYYMENKINESEEFDNQIKVGDPIYCHKTIGNYKEGEWYKVANLGQGVGFDGEDCFSIYDKVAKFSLRDYWTIQKDKYGINYEKYFSLGDPSFDTNKAFGDLF